jgi:nucleotide-binding universal stress UspA family protein
MFRKILVPYDGSKQAENALNKAVYLAKLVSGSEIFILNVIDEIKFPAPMFDKKVRNYRTREATTLSSYLRDLQKEKRDKMKKKLDELKSKHQHSAQIRTLISVGRPEVKIVQYANNEHVDLIVIGHSDPKGISRFIMGSVSRTVSEKVNCTVMIVK